LLAIGIFSDLSKAFDAVHYEILISKLYCYGFQDVVIHWIIDYLYKREQYVFINGSTSKRIKIYCGVPQGSILGPLLFLIYINDLAWMFESALPILFADYTIVISNANFVSLMNEANNVVLYNFFFLFCTEITRRGTNPAWDYTELHSTYMNKQQKQNKKRQNKHMQTDKLEDKKGKKTFYQKP